MDETARASASAVGFSDEQFAFLDNVYRFHESRMNDLRQNNQGAMAALTQVLQSSMAMQAQPRTTFEVDTKFGKPTMLEKSGGNFEDFAFKFKAHVARQDSDLAHELEKLEKPDAPAANQMP